MVDMTFNDIQHRRLTLERLLWDTNHELTEIKKNCQHTNIGRGRLTFSPGKKKIVQTYDETNLAFKKMVGNNVTVFCQDCDEEFGWFCSKSPKGYCEYNRSTNGERCIWCNDEEERK